MQAWKDPTTLVVKTKIIRKRKILLHAYNRSLQTGMTYNNDSSNNTNSKCPKCSSNMVQHPSLLSMPLTSSSPQQNVEEDMKK
jgi:predicted Zn-ribbon and HTH transcriptional regulator